MSNLVTQYIRRIGKFSTKKTDRPVVAVPGTNHIDDSDVWTNDTIYEGEQVINLATGKTYTSDSRQIVELGSNDAIIKGMQVVSIPGASLNADPLYIKVTDGYINLCGKTFRHKSIDGSISAPGDVCVTPNPSYKARYDLVYVSSDYPNKVDFDDTNYKVKLTVIKGVLDIKELYNETIINAKLVSAGLAVDESILLGIVHIPPYYNSLSATNSLRPWSWGVSYEDNDEKYLNFIQSQSFNISSIKPGFLIDYLLGRTFTHVDSDGDLRKTYVYLKNQILTYDNGNSLVPDTSLYKVLSTHLCKDLSTSIANNLIAQINEVGSPGGYTNIHNELDDLQGGDELLDKFYHSNQPINTTDDVSFNSLRLLTLEDDNVIWDFAYTSPSAIGTFQMSDNSSGPIFMALKSRGNYAAPEAVQLNDELLKFVASGFDGVSWATSNPAGFVICADGAWTTKVHPSRVDIYVGQQNSTSNMLIASGGSDGTFDFLGNIKVKYNAQFLQQIQVGNISGLTTPVEGMIRWNGVNYQGYKEEDYAHHWVNLDEIPEVQIKNTSYTLTATTIKTLNSIPFELLPSPGSGYVYQIIACTARLNYASVPFDFPLHTDTINIIDEGVLFKRLYSVEFLNQTSETRVALGKTNTWLGDNVRLLLTADGDATVGDSSLDIYLTYFVIKL